MTHIELIHNPDQDFYVHNDAAWSFYNSYMELVLPCKWSELVDKTLLVPYFSNYPLGALVMSSFGKIGQDLGIENLRLFMRLQVFMIGSIIVALIANIFSEKNFNNKEIIKLVVPFALCSYLYVTSAIFSRDIHVCLVYTMGTYIFLKDKVKFRLLWFVILFFAAAGFRLQNGILFLLFPLAFYYKALKSKYGIIGVLFIFVACFVSYFYLESSIRFSGESVEKYTKITQLNTGGVFERFYSLPFPLNTLAMIVYMIISPLPITSALLGAGKTFYNIPYIFSPFIISLCFVACLIYLKYQNRRMSNQLSLMIIVNLLVFASVVYASPDVRRCFAVIPGLWMCYGLIRDGNIHKVIQKYIYLVWTAIFVIQFFFVVYVNFS